VTTPPTTNIHVAADFSENVMPIPPHKKRFPEMSAYRDCRPVFSVASRFVQTNEPIAGFQSLSLAIAALRATSSETR
jgi:hypothetical protein